MTKPQLIGLGKNQVKLLLEAPDHMFSAATVKKICAHTPLFQANIHYALAQADAASEIRLAREHSSTLALTRGDQRGIELLYEALLANPTYQGLLPTFDSLDEFLEWSALWGNATDDPAAEQFFAYRTYRDKVLAFIYGEHRRRTPDAPLELFALWYVVGSEHAFYDGSPVGLSVADVAAFPAGDRETVTQLMIALLEALSLTPSIDFRFYEIEAVNLVQPRSLGRRLLRLYAQTEIEVRRHFAHQVVLRQCQFFVLDFPYQVPHTDADTGTVSMQDHVLVCCPMKAVHWKAFRAGSVPTAIIAALLQSIYAMSWAYLDEDAPERTAIRQETDKALTRFQAYAAAQAGIISCHSLAADGWKHISRLRPADMQPL